MTTKQSLKTWGLVGLVAGAVALMHAAGWVTTTIVVPAALYTVTNATLTSTTGTAYPLDQNVPVTLYFSTAAAQTTNTTLSTVVGFDFSADNLTWTTTEPVKGTNLNNGTNIVTGVIQLTPAQTAGFRYYRAGSIAQIGGATASFWTNALAGEFY